MDRHFGLCPDCFLRLSDDIAILGGSQIQPIIERVRTIYPARPWLSWLIGWAWKLGVTAAVGWLLWRAR